MWGTKTNEQTNKKTERAKSALQVIEITVCTEGKVKGVCKNKTKWQTCI